MVHQKDKYRSICSIRTKIKHFWLTNRIQKKKKVLSKYFLNIFLISTFLFGMVSAGTCGFCLFGWLVRSKHKNLMPFLMEKPRHFPCAFSIVMRAEGGMAGTSTNSLNQDPSRIVVYLKKLKSEYQNSGAESLKCTQLNKHHKFTRNSILEARGLNVNAFMPFLTNCTPQALRWTRTQSRQSSCSVRMRVVWLTFLPSSHLVL